MTAGVYNLEIEQGTTMSRTVSVVEDAAPKDLTGWTARAQVRKAANISAILFEISCAIIDAPGGVVEMSMTAQQTSEIPTPSGTTYNTRAMYVYDLEIESGSGEVIRVLNGACMVSPEVTR